MLIGRQFAHHLVDDGEELRRHLDAERPRHLQIEDKPELDRLNDCKPAGSAS
jgi:hypothetical protein